MGEGTVVCTCRIYPHSMWCGSPVEVVQYGEALESQVSRLREALEGISAILPCSEPCKPRVMCGTCHRRDDTDGEIDCTGCIARAALGRTTK